MFLTLYNFILLVLLGCGLPVLAVKLAAQKHYRAGLRERLGFYGKKALAREEKKPRIWIHGASVGEIQTVLPFLDEIKLAFPRYQLFFSSTTMAGVELARSKKLNAIYFPLDFYPIAAKAIERFNPSMIWVLETELWPSFVAAAARRKIPLILVNGRISDFSLRRYLLVKLWVRKVLNAFSLVCVQTEEDRNRFLRLGLLPEKLRITGNLKFDAAALRMPASTEIQGLAREFSCENSDLILVGGSTHEGEEEILAQIYLSLRKRFQTLRLVLAPRHLTRVKEIEKLLAGLGISYDLRTQLKKGKGRAPVLILNTLGELFKVYALATVVFIGKSLCGKGGQNPLEPAIFAKPILFGPHMENFREAAVALLNEKGAAIVRSKEDLEQKAQELLLRPELGTRMGKKAAAVFAAHRGAGAQTWEQIKKLPGGVPVAR